MAMNGKFPPALLSRIEDAGLNASAPPQQRWLDGWLVRVSPGKAKRARCINAVAQGKLSIEDRLAECETVYAQAGLPLIVRITPFTQPEGLDAWLSARGHLRFDDTCVMVSNALPEHVEPPPAGLVFEHATHASFADRIGALRDSPPDQRLAHAERLRWSPVPYQGWLLKRADDGAMLACAQTAVEAGMVGLYDVFTDPASRGQGLARWLCRELLRQAREGGAHTAYLQVDAANEAARSVYRALHFDDAYGYHYRSKFADAH